MTMVRRKYGQEPRGALCYGTRVRDTFSIDNVSHLLEQLEDDEKAESAHSQPTRIGFFLFKCGVFCMSCFCMCFVSFSSIFIPFLLVLCAVSCMCGWWGVFGLALALACLCLLVVRGCACTSADNGLIHLSMWADTDRIAADL